MKKNFLFAMAMAAVFAGCSSDDDPVTNAGGEVNGDKFISLSINLPTQNSTRAFDESTNLEDGLESEYKVNTADLFIFNGTDGASTFVRHFTLTTSFSDVVDDPNQVTQNSTKVVLEVGSGVQKDYGMLVVLNNNDQLSSSDLSGKTFSYVLEKISTTMPKAITNGLFMTNAPLADAFGGGSWSGNMRLLVPIKKVYNSESEAKAGDADQIYVERSVAKVTMNQGTGGNLETGNLNAASGSSISWTVNGWNLGNTNTKTYIVRNTSQGNMNNWAKLISNKAETSYRFIGTNVVTGSGYYRTYFAVDPNYDVDVNAGDLEDPITLVYDFGEENPIYCYENTFDVERMKQKNTTHAIIGVTLNGGSNDLYVVNDEKNIIYDDITKVNAIVYNAISKADLKLGLKSGESVDLNDLDIEYENSTDNTYNYVVKSIKVTTASESKYTEVTTVNSKLSTAITDINAKVKISKYADGVSYYAARIKHFGDSETPWKNGETTAPTVGNIYPDNSAANYLGRYGVLRNNWYDLNVTKISMIGEPTIDAVQGDEDDDEFDDELDAFISLQINILSWAKRTQDVEL